LFRQDGRYFWLIAALFTVFLPHTAMAESRLTAAAGAFDFFKGNHVSAAAAFELRGPVISPSWQSETFLGFAPTLGVLATSDEGGLVYAMIELPFVLGPQKNYEVSLSGGFAAYEQGDSALDMGGTAQFVLGASFSRGLANGHRLGVTVRHFSNAGLHNRNPGTDVIMAAWTVPFAK
jgi:lipid A 3-O-deacylase